MARITNAEVNEAVDKVQKALSKGEPFPPEFVRVCQNKQLSKTRHRKLQGGVVRGLLMRKMDGFAI